MSKFSRASKFQKLREEIQQEMTQLENTELTGQLEDYAKRLNSIDENILEEVKVEANDELENFFVKEKNEDNTNTSHLDDTDAFSFLFGSKTEAPKDEPIGQVQFDQSHIDHSTQVEQLLSDDFDPMALFSNVELKSNDTSEVTQQEVESVSDGFDFLFGNRAQEVDVDQVVVDDQDLDFVFKSNPVEEDSFDSIFNASAEVEPANDDSFDFMFKANQEDPIATNDVFDAGLGEEVTSTLNGDQAFDFLFNDQQSEADSNSKLDNLFRFEDEVPAQPTSTQTLDDSLDFLFSQESLKAAEATNENDIQSKHEDPVLEIDRLLESLRANESVGSRVNDIEENIDMADDITNTFELFDEKFEEVEKEVEELTEAFNFLFENTGETREKPEVELAPEIYEQESKKYNDLEDLDALLNDFVSSKFQMDDDEDLRIKVDDLEQENDPLPFDFKLSIEPKQEVKANPLDELFSENKQDDEVQSIFDEPSFAMKEPETVEPIDSVAVLEEVKKHNLEDGTLLDDKTELNILKKISQKLEENSDYGIVKVGEPSPLEDEQDASTLAIVEDWKKHTQQLELKITEHSTEINKIEGHLNSTNSMIRVLVVILIVLLAIALGLLYKLTLP